MKGVFYLFLAQIGFAFIGVFTKYIGGSVNAITLSFFRVLIASLFLLSIALAFNKSKQLSIKAKDIVPFYVIGVMFALNFVFFISAFSYTSLSEAGLITAFTPVFVYFLASKFLKEKITKNGVFALFVVLLGLYVMNFTGIDPTHLFGNFLVLVSCVFAGVMIVYTKIEDRDHTALDVVFWPMVFAAALLLPAAFTFNFSNVAATSYVWILLLGVVCTGITYFLVSVALKTIEASKYSLLGTVTYPLISIMFGAVLFGEHMTAGTVFGGMLLMAAALIIHYENHPPVLGVNIVRAVGSMIRFVRRM